jgi:hypothetical protein
MMTEMISPLLDTINTATKGCYASTEEQLVKNIGVLDVILKNYSPVAFTNGTLDRYANEFFLKYVDNIDTFYGWYINDRATYENKMAFRQRVVALHEKMKNQEADLKEDKKSAPEKEKISVDLSQSVEPKPSVAKQNVPQPVAPKVEANNSSKERIVVNEALENVGGTKVSDQVKKSNSLKEKIVIHELSEKVNGNNASARVDEHTAPVTSNLKK